MNAGDKLTAHPLTNHFLIKGEKYTFDGYCKDSGFEGFIYLKEFQNKIKDAYGRISRIAFRPDSFINS